MWSWTEGGLMMVEGLLGKSDHELRVIAETATHQHYKGGLYRLVGTACDADTGRLVKGKDGAARVLYEHLFPFERQFWMLI
jgi:hypothetical protein